MKADRFRGITLPPLVLPPQGEAPPPTRGGTVLPGGPAPFDLELQNMVITFHWNASGSTLRWWFGPFGRRFGRNRC